MKKNLLKLIFVKAIVKENVVTKAKYVKSEILKTKESDKFVRQEEWNGELNIYVCNYSAKNNDV